MLTSSFHNLVPAINRNFQYDDLSKTLLRALGDAKHFVHSHSDSAIFLSQDVQKRFSCALYFTDSKGKFSSWLAQTFRQPEMAQKLSAPSLADGDGEFLQSLDIAGLGAG